jgi:hypothetical protein
MALKKLKDDSATALSKKKPGPDSRELVGRLNELRSDFRAWLARCSDTLDDGYRLSGEHLEAHSKCFFQQGQLGQFPIEQMSKVKVVKGSPPATTFFWVLALFHDGPYGEEHSGQKSAKVYVLRFIPGEVDEPAVSNSLAFDVTTAPEELRAHIQTKRMDAIQCAGDDEWDKFRKKHTNTLNVNFERPIYFNSTVGRIDNTKVFPVSHHSGTAIQNASELECVNCGLVLERQLVPDCIQVGTKILLRYVQKNQVHLPPSQLPSRDSPSLLLCSHLDPSPTLTHPRLPIPPPVV